MEKEYLRTSELIENTGDFKWIDRDMGQLEIFEHPPVDWPCALIKTSIISAKDIGGNMQQCVAMIGIRLAFNNFIETSNLTPEDIRLAGMEYERAAQRVYLALQGQAGGRGGKFSRVSQSTDIRPDDGLTVVSMGFTLPFLDKSAAT